MNNALTERQGISIYINDILRLEFITNRLQKKYNNLLQEIQHLDSCIPMRCKEYRALQPNSYQTGIIKFMFGYDGDFFHFDVDYQQQGTQPTEYGGYQSVYWYSSDSYDQVFNEYSRLTPERLEMLSKPLIKRVPKLFGGYKEIVLGNWIPNNAIGGISPEFRDIFLNDLELFKPELKTEWLNTQNKLALYRAKIQEIEKELGQSKVLLRKEYSLNIIPNKFRSLNAMYFICDYFDSSNETLNNIFFHIDLEEIKQKLDAIISNQEKIIINQAIQISQNKEIISQNQRILCSLSELERSSNQIEKNTAGAEQWAKIAANNAEACAWIGFANYIKD